MLMERRTHSVVHGLDVDRGRRDQRSRQSSVHKVNFGGVL